MKKNILQNYIYSKEDLIKEFKEAGIKKGYHVILHSSLGSLGYVVNGANDVIDSLLKIVGKEGTLLMPAHSGDKTDPVSWTNPPVKNKSWLVKIRKTMEPFDPATTPIRNRGVIPTTFLLYDGVCRSNHPIASIIAKGRLAKYFTKEHSLHDSEGIQSPIGRLYQNNGYALLLGVGLSANTSFHLAEYLANVSYLAKTNVKVLVKKGGRNYFIRLKRYPAGSLGFDNIEQDLIDNNLIVNSKIGNAKVRLIALRPAIDFIVKKLNSDSDYLLNKKGA